MKVSFIQYDLPKVKRIRNPSYILRRRGARIGGSVWILPTDHVPHSLVNSLREKGAIINEVPSEVLREAAVEMVLFALHKELAEKEAKAMKLADKAHDILTEGDPKHPYRTATEELTVYLRKTRANIQSIKRLAVDLAVAAKLFGIDPDVLPLESIGTAADLITFNTHERAQEYVRMAEEAGKLGETGKAIALAAQADDIPALILADYIEENGGDTTKVRELFASV